MSDLLLDTHAVLWFFWDDPLLSSTAKVAIENADNRKLVSIASCWEIAIKTGLSGASSSRLSSRRFAKAARDSTFNWSTSKAMSSRLRCMARPSYPRLWSHCCAPAAVTSLP
jgi:hypothetical protein